MNSNETDAELVKRVQNGDSKAFDVLVIKYQQRVINLITRFVSDYSECQDIAQEAFMKAYKGLHNFRGDSQFYTWLYRIAANSAKNYLASKSRKVPAQGIDAQDAEFYDGESRLKDRESPESLMLTKEIEKTVFASIEALPEDLKTAIRLREMQGMSYDEIAQIMDCPIGTVRSRIFRAREAIDAELRPLIE